MGKLNFFNKIKKSNKGDMIINNLLNSDEIIIEIITFLQICAFVSFITLFFEAILLNNLWKKGYFTTLIVFYFYFAIIYICLSFNMMNLLITKFSNLEGLSMIFGKNC